MGEYRFLALLDGVAMPGDKAKPCKLALLSAQRTELARLAVEGAGFPKEGMGIGLEVDQLTITVRGHPTTQGNKQGFVVTPKGGKPRAIVTEKASSKLHAWRHAVSDEARKAMGDRPALEGPLAIRVDFRLPRPKSHPKTRRTWPTGARSGDADKLARAVLDALTGVVFADDSQVVELVSTKDYDRGPGIRDAHAGAVITVIPAEDEPSVPLFGEPT